LGCKLCWLWLMHPFHHRSFFFIPLPRFSIAPLHTTATALHSTGTTRTRCRPRRSRRCSSRKRTRRRLSLSVWRRALGERQRLQVPQSARAPVHRGPRAGLQLPSVATRLPVRCHGPKSRRRRRTWTLDFTTPRSPGRPHQHRWMKEKKKKNKKKNKKKKKKGEEEKEKEEEEKKKKKRKGEEKRMRWTWMRWMNDFATPLLLHPPHPPPQQLARAALLDACHGASPASSCGASRQSCRPRVRPSAWPFESSLWSGRPSRCRSRQARHLGHQQQQQPPSPPPPPSPRRPRRECRAVAGPRAPRA